MVFLMVFSLFLLGCSDAEQAAIAESMDISLPDDVPVYPNAVPTSGFVTGYLTTVTYHVNEDSDEVHDWHNVDANIPPVWDGPVYPAITLDDDGNIISRAQYFYQTADYNPNPNMRSGRQILYTIAEADEGGTTIVIGYLNYDQ